MTPVTWEPTICPGCHRVLEGLGTYCLDCGDYVANLAGAHPKAKAAPGDDRTEAEVQLAIRRAAELLGYEVYDLSQPRATMQTPGLPDCYVRGHGRRVWIECKRPHGGKLSEAQHRFIAAELGNGGDAIVARSVEDFLDWHNGRTS